MKRFAVRPEPHLCESFNGFLLRVGKLNCIFQPAEILQYLGMGTKLTPASGNFGWLEAPSKEIFRALERLLEKKSLDSHRVRFKKRSQLAWQYSKQRMIFDLRLGFPRICPSCVSEHGFLDWRWGLAVTAHCPKHECLLTSSCPSCEKPLKWSGGLLIGCLDGCGKNWSEMESSRSKITETERKLWEDLNAESSVVDDSFLRDVCFAMVVSMRPFDVIHESIRYCPKLIDHSDFVSRAYLLLESPSVNAAWREQCQEKRKDVHFLGKDFIEAPSNMFMAHLERHWQGPHEETQLIADPLTEEYDFPESTAYISQSRRDRTLEHEESSNYRYQVSVLSFATIIGLSKDSAQEFFRGDALIAHKNVRFSASRRFDLRQFRHIIQAHPKPENSIEITPGNIAFNKCFATFGRLANDVILCKIDGGFSKTSGVRSIFLDRDVFERWLTAQLARTKPKGLRPRDAANTLHCTVGHIHNLVAQKSLEWADSQSKDPRVNNRSLCRHVMLMGQMRSLSVSNTPPCSSFGQVSDPAWDSEETLLNRSWP